MTREPKFKVGDVLMVSKPEQFIKHKTFRDREAVLLENILDLAHGPVATPRKFQGRIRIEFQRRNGRGKVFQEVMNERWFEPFQAPPPKPVD